MLDEWIDVAGHLDFVYQPTFEFVLSWQENTDTEKEIVNDGSDT